MARIVATNYTNAEMCKLIVRGLVSTLCMAITDAIFDFIVAVTSIQYSCFLDFAQYWAMVRLWLDLFVWLINGFINVQIWYLGYYTLLNRWVSARKT